jgi:hypothetical protein
LEWGKHADFLEQIAASGMDVPAIKNRPSVSGWELEVWRAFHLLHAQRQVGFAPSPIALSDIRALLEVYAVADDMRAELVELVLSLDSEWLSWARENSDGD